MYTLCLRSGWDNSIPELAAGHLVQTLDMTSSFGTMV